MDLLGVEALLVKFPSDGHPTRNNSYNDISFHKPYFVRQRMVSLYRSNTISDRIRIRMTCKVGPQNRLIVSIEFISFRHASE